MKENKHLWSRPRREEEKKGEKRGLGAELLENHDIYFSIECIS